MTQIVHKRCGITRIGLSNREKRIVKWVAWKMANDPAYAALAQARAACRVYKSRKAKVSLAPVKGASSVVTEG